MSHDEKEENLFETSISLLSQKSKNISHYFIIKFPNNLSKPEIERELVNFNNIECMIEITTDRELFASVIQKIQDFNGINSFPVFVKIYNVNYAENDILVLQKRLIFDIQKTSCVFSVGFSSREIRNYIFNNRYRAILSLLNSLKVIFDKGYVYNNFTSSDLLLLRNCEIQFSNYNNFVKPENVSYENWVFRFYDANKQQTLNKEYDFRNSNLYSAGALLMYILYANDIESVINPFIIPRQFSPKASQDMSIQEHTQISNLVEQKINTIYSERFSLDELLENILEVKNNHSLYSIQEEE